MREQILHNINEVQNRTEQIKPLISQERHGYDLTPREEKQVKETMDSLVSLAKRLQNYFF